MQKLILLSAVVSATTAQVQGTAFGIASGTTGGGSAAPAYPSRLSELKTWLTHSTARVIVIDRAWDFRSSEGSTTGQCCSDDRTTKCRSGTSKRSAWIQDTCTIGTWISCTNYNSPRMPIDVSPDKSIVGVGAKGSFVGKGLRIRGGNSNSPSQNIHPTEFNQQYVWGGDAITLGDTDKVWIGCCKFSPIGRQIIVGKFDGVTTWSAGCNGENYWTLLLIGEKDFYPFSGNWLRDMSGRAPHLGTTSTTSSENLFHAVNNYFQNVGRHAFDVGGNTWALLEGNYFDAVTTPVTGASSTLGGNIFAVNTVANAQSCSSPLGFVCEWNRASGSGTVTPLTSLAALIKLSSYKTALVGHIGVADVPATVDAIAGIGKTTSTNSKL